MLVQKVFEIRKSGNPLTTDQSQHLDFIRTLPNVPVLSETLFLIELGAGKGPVELTRISKLILSDLGATIQVLRLASLGRAESGHSNRIEDCIAGLGVDACLDAMSKQTILRTDRYAAVVAAWEHARIIAEVSSQLAETMAENTLPEEATLVGLCHEIGSLPKLLGWVWKLPRASEVDFTGYTMAEAWSLPSCVKDYFAGRLEDGAQSQWPAIVDRAHEIANTPACPFR